MDFDYILVYLDLNVGIFGYNKRIKEEIVSLAETLKENSSLTELYLSFNKIRKKVKL